MAIARIGSGGANATTITIPVGHQAGDVIVIFAYNTASSTAPSLPAGYTSVCTGNSTATAQRTGYKIATSSADSSGTWTNASNLACVVYRGQSTVRVPVVGAGTGAGASSLVVGWSSSDAFLHVPSDAWVIQFLGYSSTDTNAEAPLAPFVNQVDTVGASSEATAADTNGIRGYGLGSFLGGTALNQTLTGTAGLWASAFLTILPDDLTINNYQFVKVGDGMSVSEKIR